MENITTYIHIGPFKTGTTALQNAFYNNRDRLIETGVLYPETGLLKSTWGPRHYKLAHDDGTRFKQLFEEINQTKGVEKVVLSAERFCMEIDTLVKNLSLFPDQTFKLVVSIRPEVALTRSMYLQRIKSAYRTFKRPSKYPAFPVGFKPWFAENHDMFNYYTMLKPWVDAYGADSVCYVPYRRDAGFDIVKAVTAAIDIPLDLPVVATKKKMNPSIGVFAEQVWRAGVRAGHITGSLALDLGTRLEQRFPKLKKGPLKGFDEQEVEQFYKASRDKAFAEFDGFEEAYKAASGA